MMLIEDNDGQSTQLRKQNDNYNNGASGGGAVIDI
jgi:hypothetical protein